MPLSTEISPPVFLKDSLGTAVAFEGNFFSCLYNKLNDASSLAFRIPRIYFFFIDMASGLFEKQKKTKTQIN
jgi:hypothetical protein